MGKYVQVVDANWRIPYVGGWCEGYVEGAWGKATQPTQNNQTTSGVYASAMTAWNSEPNKHYDLPPRGITVPVYFSLGSTSYGHVAIRLDDLMVASSTQSGFHTQGYLHPNIDNLIKLFAQYNNGCTYLGWGEHVGGMRVVEYQPDITTKDETTTSHIAFETKYVEDATLPKDEEKTLQEGQDGYRTIVTRITFSDGVETNRSIVSDTTANPTDKIIAKGTYVAPEPEKPIEPEVPELPEESFSTFRQLLRNILLAIKALLGNILK